MQMDDTILELSDRGQLTIPKKIRQQIMVKRFICRTENGNVVLEPLQTREEFLTELDSAEKDWKKNGGLTLKAVKQKYNL